MDEVAVVTFTLYSRLPLLIKCINSVKCQLGKSRIKHYIWYKEDEVEKYIKSEIGSQENLFLVKYIEPDIKHTQQKMAILRNMAVDYIEEQYIAFLDDDNEYNPIHIQSLLNVVLENGFSAAHSLRYLVFEDDTLFDGTFYPWHYDNETTKDVYDWCIKNKILILNSPIMYDRYVEDSSEFNIATIDMNEWLFNTNVIKKIRFNEDFTPNEKIRLVGEDGKILESIRENGVTYGASNLPTVKYRLGGFSNSFYFSDK